MRVRPLTRGDRAWLARMLKEHWGSTTLVSRGRVHRGERLEGLVAELDGLPTGVLLHEQRGDEFEVVLLHALEPGRGLGSALLEEAVRAAGARGCRRLWLVTTNDNAPALAFYRRRGLEQVAVHVGAVAEDRRLKPEIPMRGLGGVPIEDEIEFELRLDR